MLSAFKIMKLFFNKPINHNTEYMVSYLILVCEIGVKIRQFSVILSVVYGVVSHAGPLCAYGSLT